MRFSEFFRRRRRPRSAEEYRVEQRPRDAVADDLHTRVIEKFCDPDEFDHQLWRDGKLVPAYISQLLDAAGLTGPEVDIACRAHEPEVDLWEIGRLYPRWEQTVALARLLDVRVRCLAHPDAQPGTDTSRPQSRRPSMCHLYLSVEPTAVQQAITAPPATGQA